GRGQGQKLGEEEEANLSRGYPGMTLDFLLDMLDQEFTHYEYKREKESPDKGKRSGRGSTADDASDAAEKSLPASEANFYCRVHRLKPLIEDQHDSSSYGALRKKLRELRSARLFDRRDAPKLNMVRLSEPGH